MRVLFVVPYTPNLIRVRSYNLIRHLTKRGHQVTVLTLSRDRKEEADAIALADHCHQVIYHSLPRWRSLWNCLVALPTSDPLQSAYCWQPTLAEQLRQFLNGHSGQQPFDVVHVEHLRGVRYGLQANELLWSNGKSLPVIWDSVDCISSLFRQASGRSKSTAGRWMTRIELGRTERYEGWLLDQFQRILVTSPVDKEALMDLANQDKPAAQVDVLPNGVDLEYFRPDSSVAREPATLVVSGKMSYHANITMVLHLVQDIMPLVWAQKPDIRLFIVGKDPSPSIQQLDGHPSVSVTGTVPDIRPYLQRATMAVAPLTYGAGIQNKILEAMACQTPVIVTPQATAALAAVKDRDLVSAESPSTFAEQILALIADPERQHALGRNGRSYVEAHHHWGAIAGQLEGLYKATMDRIN